MRRAPMFVTPAALALTAMGLAFAALVNLPGAHAATDAGEAPGEAPRYRVGDTWVYTEINQLSRQVVGSIVREVTQVSPDIRIATRDEAGKTLDDAQFRSAGLQTRGSLGPGAGAFEPPLELRPFPLRPGHQWTQKTRMSDAYWRETRLMRVTGRVEAWEAVRIGGRDMRALRIIRSMSLGDADGFRGDTQRTEWEWWVPEVRAPARLIVWEEHREPDGRFGELIIDRHVRYELEEARLARP